MATASVSHRASIVEGGVVYERNLSEFVHRDQKLFFPATDRNKEAILHQLRPFFDKARLVLEVGSGSGQHLYHFSKDYPEVTFQPTEYDTTLFQSIDAHAMDLPGHSIRRPLELDATNPEHWSTVLRAGHRGEKDEGEEVEGVNLSLDGVYDLVLTTNVFHISPWIVGQSIVRGAGQVLKPSGYFILYGAFKKDGKFNAPSNEQFDQTLRGRDASWGVRDIEAIEAVAVNESKMVLKNVIDMPSNNHLLIFQRVASEE
ncbi:hypothetical protein BGZ83_002095 [Gryganskiella cystojenkinii]|nr:hypothetical protein BGZ83_002095 [Gryganskiella cystojenkinii]